MSCDNTQMVRPNASHLGEEHFPTIQLMVTRCSNSVGTTFRIIRNIIHAKERERKILVDH